MEAQPETLAIASPHPLMKGRWYMYITQFVSGMSVMAVELGASRLIAPYFSSSQIIWTIIIGSIMIAMAIGNFLGGKLADKHPSIARLYFFMLLSGTWITLIPFLGRFVIAGITAFFAMFINAGLLIWASFFTCFILFIPPLLLLGTVTPSLIKYAQTSGNTSGKVVGILEALGTVGSILGTFLPTFLTIPTIGTAWTFLTFGVILFVLGLVYFLVDWIARIRKQKAGKKVETSPSEKKAQKKDDIGKIVACSLCLLGTISGCFLNTQASFAFWDSKIKYTGESIYNYLQIREDGDTRYFSTNVMFSFQSVIKNKGEDLTGYYYDYAMAAPLMAENAKNKELDVLVLGMAMGTYATQLQKFYPDYKLNITGVEIDEKMIALAHDWFYLSPDIPVVAEDGRAYLRMADKTKKWDVMLLDAYSGISVPFQMASKEFFELTAEHLNDGGVIVSNINMVDERPGSVDDALAETMKNVYPYVYSYTLGGGSTNRELFASKSSLMMSNLSSRMDSLVKTELKTPFNKVLKNSKEVTAKAICLTDDNADVELRSMSAIDGIIAGELEQYRAIFRQKGLWGLIQYLLS
jgi:spermidine synthase